MENQSNNDDNNRKEYLLDIEDTIFQSSQRNCGLPDVNIFVYENLH